MQLPFISKQEKQAIVFIGIQASGKSTFFDRVLAPLGYAHINLDTLRTRHQESLVLKECLAANKSFVVDNTNPELTDRQRYIPLAKKHGYEVIGIFFQSRLHDCIKRNEKRENPVPRLAIPGTQNKLKMPSLSEGFDALYFVKITEDGFQITQWED